METIEIQKTKDVLAQDYYMLSGAEREALRSADRNSGRFYVSRTEDESTRGELMRKGLLKPASYLLTKKGEALAAFAREAEAVVLPLPHAKPRRVKQPPRARGCFSEAVKALRLAVDDNGAYPPRLKGIFVEPNGLTATDGHVLVHLETGTGIKNSRVINPTTGEEIAGAELYPQWQRVVPEEKVSYSTTVSVSHVLPIAKKIYSVFGTARLITIGDDAYFKAAFVTKMFSALLNLGVESVEVKVCNGTTVAVLSGLSGNRPVTALMMPIIPSEHESGFDPDFRLEDFPA